MKKYENWSKVLIEPSSLNDARLYSLETRIHEEEDIRVKEYEFMRDFLRKFLYSFHQSVSLYDSIMPAVKDIKSPDKQSDGDKSPNEKGGGMLPFLDKGHINNSGIPLKKGGAFS